MYHDTIIIGGGQTGLALGRLLADRGHDVTILEAADQPAAAWRERWDSLRLFTPARYDSLPGKPFPGDPGSALLGWVNQDAAHIAHAVATHRVRADYRIAVDSGR
jgi:cation diffusion facilitator CzcD-associated flavoprotein CzcO